MIRCGTQFVTIGLLLIIVGASPSLSLSQVRYELQENEYLFVAGKEYRVLELTSNGDTVALNGVVVRKPLPPAEPQGIPGLWGRDTLFSRVPAIRELERSGMDSDDIEAFYRRKVTELYYHIQDLVKDVRSGMVSVESGQQAIDEYLLREGNRGYILEAQIIGDDLFRWQPFASRDGEVIMNVKGFQEDRAFDVAEFEDRYIEHFKGSDFPELMIIGPRGGTAFIVLRDSDQLVQQLRAVEAGGRYVSGPSKREDLVNWGFIAY